MKPVKAINLLVLFFAIQCWSQQDSVKILLDKNSSVELFRENFDSKNHKLEFKEKALISIDNIPIFGTDGEMPKYVLAKAILKIGNKTYNLQVDNMYNPWFGAGVNETLFRIIHENSDNHLFKAQFSDGAGSYAAEWLIEGNSSIRDIITKDEIIIESYFENKK